MNFFKGSKRDWSEEEIRFQSIMFPLNIISGILFIIVGFSTNFKWGFDKPANEDEAILSPIFFGISFIGLLIWITYYNRIGLPPLKEEFKSKKIINSEEDRKNYKEKVLIYPKGLSFLQTICTIVIWQMAYNTFCYFHVLDKATLAIQLFMKHNSFGWS